ncbi:MAG: hypothetical protein B7Z57_11595 [Acidiphilium sp. 37-60-79]|nr:MAG: hypothetical protein B7Z57_11595 [Acidiphilium sp. 37-60-79]OZB40857.1 MAG: hypothetical protein B7X48_03260 [Acidiphilium sp. 34-60-192]
MSGTVEPIFPATVTITQVAGPTVVTVQPLAPNAVPVGVPPYPLSTNPAQSWYLTVQAGVLAWVQSAPVPGSAALALEDAQGFFLLEDGGGAILTEV